MSVETPEITARTKPHLIDVLSRVVIVELILMVFMQFILIDLLLAGEADFVHPQDWSTIGWLMFDMGLTILLWHRVARRASDLARKIWLFLTAPSVLLTVWYMTDGPGQFVINFILLSCSVALQIFSIWILLRPDVVRWVKTRDSSGR